MALQLQQMTGGRCEKRGSNQYWQLLHGVYSRIVAALLLSMHVVQAGREGAFINYSEKGLDSNCKDLSDWCPVWAHDGECTRNPSLPETTCRMSCGSCKAPGNLVPPHNENGTIVLETPHGQIEVQVLRDIAPSSAALVYELAARKGCRECRFYRNEVPPESGYGPPYGLLQGSLLGLVKLPESEGHIPMKRGHVAFIPGTAEFFIAAMDHPEWGNSHIVWGQVADMAVVETVLQLPYHTYTHPQYGTVMRMMDTEIKFGISYRPPQQQQQR